MKLTLVDGDDWAGLYVNGTLAVEGHTVDAEEAIEVIMLQNNVPTEFEKVECDGDWLADVGSLPRYLAEVVWPGEYESKDEFDDADGDYADDPDDGYDDAYAGPDITY